jgi:hypothetical protein
LFVEDPDEIPWLRMKVFCAEKRLSMKEAIEQALEAMLGKG